MNHETQRASILQMAQGAFQERVDYEMQRCVDNILDVNTKATAKRKITLTIELTPDDDRRQIRVNVVAKARSQRPIRSQHRFASPLMATGKWSLPKWCRSSPARCAWTGMNRKHRKF